MKIFIKAIFIKKRFGLKKRFAKVKSYFEEIAFIICNY